MYMQKEKLKKKKNGTYTVITIHFNQICRTIQKFLAAGRVTITVNNY